MSIHSEATQPRQTAPAPDRGGQLGRYAIEGQLGAGGMGEILAVFDPQLGRRLAAKVIRGTPDSTTLAKFVLEARVTGQLQHPGIPPIHELGTDPQGQPYFTMKEINGCTLADLLDPAAAGAKSLAELLGAFLCVCDAVSFAHARGVIHRDLKPANVMIGEFGEVLVLDWGLAGLFDVSHTDGTSRSVATAVRELGVTTPTGEFVGTPAYMPPEQADGRPEAIGPRIDVYALGAILYEIVCRQRAFEGVSALAIIGRAVSGELVPPSRRARDVPRELEAVVLRAMALDAAARYPTVSALRDDVAAYLEGRRVSAARYSLAQLATRAMRRHPMAALAAVLLSAFAALAATAGGWLIARRADAERVAAAERQARTDSDERAHRSELVALARAGDVEELIAKLIGQRIEARSAALADFRREWAKRGSESPEQFVARVGRERLIDYLTAFDKLVAGHAEHGDRVPIDAHDHFLRGLLNELLGNAKPALESYSAAIALDPQHADARYNRANLYIDAGDDRAAMADYDAAIAARPCAMFYQARASIHTRRGARDAAIADLDQAIAFDPQAATAYVNRGLERARLGQLEPAMVDFDRAVAIDPKLARAYYARGQVRFTRGELDAALVEYERAIALDATIALFFESRGELRRDRNQLALALADFERGRDLEPTSAHMWALCGSIRAAMGDTDGALAHFDRALELDPRDVDARVYRGLALQDKGRSADALAEVDRAIELEPRNAASWNTRGHLRARQHDLEGALEDYDRALELDPRHAYAASNRAGVLLALGRLDEAATAFDRAIELDPRSATAYFGRAEIHSSRGRVDLAIADLDRAIALDPRMGTALVNRGIIEHKTAGNLARALEYYDRAIAVAPTLYQAWLNRALALRSLGRRAEAAAALEQAIRCCPPDERARLEGMRPDFAPQ